MKKLFVLIAAAWMALGLSAASYGILLNGETFVPGTKQNEFEGFTQYLSKVQVKSGDYCQLYDADNKVAWAVDLNTSSVAGFTRNGDRYVVSTDGCFDFYIKLKYNADELYIGEGTGCTNGDDPGTDPVDPGTDDPTVTCVPDQCEDIILQAFYWNSYEGGDNAYGATSWSALKGKASEITPYFDMVWLAPSCKAKDNMGYLPMQYSNQNSNKMGYEQELKTLISALHAGNTKVIADVVINHAGDINYIYFQEQDFGMYGKFEPQPSWITSNDEKGQSGSHADDGQNGNDANYGSARDWDHQNPNVQNMCKAYLKFLKNTMKYDGFRFDYSGGYHVSHTRDYLRASAPYFSVMEYWNRDADHLKARIDDAEKTTLTFDFPAYYTAFKEGIAQNNYGGCVKAGMRSKGYEKYAVLFVDNHDTFKRDINSDVAGSSDGSSLNNRALILQCNAYMLSMPGVPCVFWPHWYTYKDAIQAMIIARKSAGIHSESTVEETSGSGWYEATVTGKNGKVVLYLGSSADKAAPAGYKQALKESKVAMYYTGDTFVPEEHPGDEPGSGQEIVNPDVADALVYKFYALGWINGGDVNPTAGDETYMFKDGKLTIDCKMGSYIALKDEQDNYYQAKTNDVVREDKVTLTWCNGWAGGQRWALKEGTRYIIMRKAKFKGEIVLESVDKATYDAYSIVTYTQGVKDVESQKSKVEKGEKFLQNGQLLIRRGDKIYDVMGREL